MLDFAVRDATRIHRRWSGWTSRFTLSPANADIDAYIATYPDLIALAGILADARRQIWNTAVATPARAHAVDAVYASVGRQFPQHRDQNQPIEHWIDDQQLSAPRISRPGSQGREQARSVE
ncbi:hypothetical protein AWC16_21815 [Mycolicibacter longobardus]|nr:hypothetical protein AWC16_21815 [Mycolicibacter longobardus]